MSFCKRLTWVMLFCALQTFTSAAGIATDGTMGARRSLSGGTQVVIPDTLGMRRGANLFHSFDDFQIGLGQTATFTQTQSGAIRSIFARVTGSEISEIKGTLQSTIPGADLYFLNPNGVKFGEVAEVKVDGSFFVSTADQLNFSDRAIFATRLTNNADSLTSAAISSFGFLEHSPSAIEIGSSKIKTEGRGFTAVGGAGGVFVNRVVNGTEKPNILTNGGALTLTAVGSRANVGIDGRITRIGPRWKDTKGISINLATIDTSGEQGGRITIRAPKFGLYQSAISSTTTGDTRGQPIEFVVSGKTEMNFKNSISTSASGRGIAGDIKISSGSLSLKDSQLSSSATASAAKGASAGAIRFHVGNMKVSGDAKIFSTTAGHGNGGIVQIRAGRLVLADADISANTATAGHGGRVSIRANRIYVGSKGTITANTSGVGAGGSVSVTGNELRVSAGGVISANSTDKGNGGNVALNAGQLTVSGKDIDSGEGSSVNANSSGRGQGGNVSVAARSIRIENKGRIEASVLETGTGRGGNVAVKAKRIALEGEDSGIFANQDATSRNAMGGNVSVKADKISIQDGALITTRLTGPGRAGNIAVKVGDLSIARLGSESRTGIAADAAANSTGQAGNVRVDAGRIFIADGGQISSNAAANGVGGNVCIEAGELSIVGGLEKTFIGTESGMQSETGGDIFSTGIGGNVFVDVGSLSLLKGGQISATTFCSGPAGNARVRAGRVFIEQGNSNSATGVFSESESEIQNGASGSVWLDADKLTILNGGRVSALTLGPGVGGDVSVTAKDAVFSRAGSFGKTGLLAESFSTTIGGKGGSVRAKFGMLTLTGGSISATAAGPGAGGSVFIEADAVKMDQLSSIEAAANGTGSAGSVAVTSRSTIALRGGSEITVKSAISDAGSIRLIAPDSISLQNSKILAEAGLNGGDVFIDPQFVILDHSSISANAILGAGGNITLIADTFLSSESAVTASSEASVQGTVDIQSPDAQLANALTALPGGLLGTDIKLTDRCPMRLSSELSSFLVIGRGGLPPAPEDLR